MTAAIVRVYRRPRCAGRAWRSRRDAIPCGRRIARAAQSPGHKILSRRDADVQAFARSGPRHAAAMSSRRRDHFLAWERTKQRLMVEKTPAVHSVQSTAAMAVGEEGSMTTPPRSTPPREPGADKSQQTKEQTTQHTAGSKGGPDYSVPPYGPGPGWPPYGPPPYGMPYGPPPYGMPYGQQPPGAPYGQQQQGGPYGQQPFGMPIGPQQCFMPPGMLPFMPPFGPGPLQWFWSWLMPWWWSWLMSWWVFPGGVGGWQLPPFPNPAQYDMTMQFAADARGVLEELVRSRGQGRPAGGERQPLPGHSLGADAARRPWLLSAADAVRRCAAAGAAGGRHGGAQRMPEIDERPEAGGDSEVGRDRDAARGTGVPERQAAVGRGGLAVAAGHRRRAPGARSRWRGAVR